MAEWDDDTRVGDALIPTTQPAGGRDLAYLIVLQGANVGEMFKIAKPEIIIGRGQGTDLTVLDDGVSRRHCALRSLAGEIVVEDLGSRNGTFVNGNPITRQRLADGDKIQVGSTTILKFSYHDRLDESFQQQMYESALRDGLTRAFNKKYFLDRLESEFRFARRHQVPLSVILFDIDHFKQVNDQHGHLFGDLVLQQLARRIADSIRTEDVFARYGGEEFGVICRAIELPNALVFGERMRLAIASQGFRAPVDGTSDGVEGSPVTVTISLGVAGLPAQDVATSAALLAAADEALYVAKRSGRNRVVAAGVVDPAPSAPKSDPTRSR